MAKSNNIFRNLRNYFFQYTSAQDTKMPGKLGQAKDIRHESIAQIIFSRATQDIKKWRDAVVEAEAGIEIMRQRVKMQQIYMDTLFNGHAFGCYEVRKQNVLKKQFDLIDASGNINEKATELIRKDWFFRTMDAKMDSLFYGYSLLNFSDVINNELFSRDREGNPAPITVIPRPWVSPDRLRISSVPYMIGGTPFRDKNYKDDFGNCPFDWTFYFSTPSDNGVATCGYGLLYKVALYEIYLRALIGQYATFVELFGQPTRHGKTMKTGDERDDFFNNLVDMGSSGVIVTDPADEIEFIESRNSGSGWQAFDELKSYLEKSISKVILGHADAMDSTPGKLGANTEIQTAIKMKESFDCKAVEHDINVEVLPKLRNLGLDIPEGLQFAFRNVQEQEEFRRKEDESNKITADLVKTLSDAGYKVAPEWIQERTSIPITEKEQASQADAASAAERIKNLYNNI